MATEITGLQVNTTVIKTAPGTCATVLMAPAETKDDHGAIVWTIATSVEYVDEDEGITLLHLGTDRILGPAAKLAAVLHAKWPRYARRWIFTISTNDRRARATVSIVLGQTQHADAGTYNLSPAPAPT